MNTALILAEPRTGSSRLLQALFEGEGYKYQQFEPYINEERDHVKSYKYKDDCVTKVITFDRVDIKWYKKLIDFHDKVICLSRRNLKAQVESYWALHHISDNYPNKPWSSSALPEDYGDLMWKEHNIKLSKRKNKLIADTFNIERVYYEDIFYEGFRPKGWKFKEDLLHLKYKARRDTKPALL